MRLSHGLHLRINRMRPKTGHGHSEGSLALYPPQSGPGQRSSRSGVRLYSARAAIQCIMLLPTPGGPCAETTNGFCGASLAM